MFKSIIEDVKREYRTGNTLTRLILLNLFVFVGINIFFFLSTNFNAGQTPTIYYDTIRFFSMPSDPGYLLTHPWTPLTSMFMHESFWHILWNMLFLYWFGRIVGDLIGDRHILPMYLFAGFIGAFVFMGSVLLLGYAGDANPYALGASAAVMGFVMGAGIIAPEYILNLILIGPVKLKYVVAVLIFLDLIGTAGNINTGGHFAHLGGAAAGWFYINRLRSGVDIGSSFDQLFGFFRIKTAGGNGIPRPNRLQVAHKTEFSLHDEQAQDEQAELDRILEKIHKQGYDQLNEEEKEFLYNASKK